jgi:hypothetical protein
MAQTSYNSLARTYEASMPSLNDFRHRLHVATRLAIFLLFFIENTPENAKLVKSKLLGMMPWGHLTDVEIQ